MAQYKVPQDVEADDKLIGPFNFRQFVYLMIIAGLIGICILLFRVFPLLAIIPLPFIIFLGLLALPLKKDQPMETYLSAIVSFHLKPRTRTWEPGQGETTIVITAPKQTEEIRTKGLSEEEALHRLSFLADIVDTEGYAIKDDTTSHGSMNSEFYAEAAQTPDIFESAQENNAYQNLDNSTQLRHDQLVNQMRSAIEHSHDITASTAPTITSTSGQNLSTPGALSPQPTLVPDLPANPLDAKDGLNNSTIIRPGQPITPSPAPVEPEPESEPSQEIIELANNPDFTIETIAKQAKRIEEKQANNEVYVSLH